MTTNDELKLRGLEGGHTPFRVPEGYFENFTERLSERLPRQPQTAKAARLTPRFWRYAAAVVLFVGVGSAAALFWSRPHTGALTDDVSQEEYYNAALDYIMVDNMEIAEYLTEAE